MNRTFNLLTYSFAIFGLITGLLFFFSDFNTIKYVQISIMGCSVFDVLSEITSEPQKKNAIIYKSIFAIIICIIMGLILLNGR